MENQDYQKLIEFRKFLINLEELHQNRSCDQTMSDSLKMYHLGIADGLNIIKLELEKVYPFLNYN